MYHVKESNQQGKKVEFSNNISFSGTNVLKEWYAACQKYPSLSFWADRTHPEWNRRIDNYYSIIYQAAMGIIPREYLVARGKDIEDHVQKLIQEYIMAGMPEVPIDDKVNFAKVVFRAEEITDDLKGDVTECSQKVCSPQEVWEFDP
jgi:hypothetical protein